MIDRPQSPSPRGPGQLCPKVKLCDLCTVIAKASWMGIMVRSRFSPLALFQLLVTGLIGTTGRPSSSWNRYGPEYPAPGTNNMYTGKSLRGSASGRQTISCKCPSVPLAATFISVPQTITWRDPTTATVRVWAHLAGFLSARATFC
jgi:hypothetical protein